MRSSFRAKVVVSLLILGLGLTLVSGYVGQVNASSHPMMRPHHNFHIYYFPYYYYYPYYYSNYYPYYYGSSMYGMYPYSGMGYGYGGYGYSASSQYQLTVNSNPPSLSGQVTGGGAFSSGSTAPFSVNQNIVQVSPDTRYLFSGWTGDYSGTGTSGSITMNSAKMVTAIYQTQYYLSISAQPSGAPSPQGSGWFNAGDTATIPVPVQIANQNAGSQLVFTGWTLDGNSNQAAPTLQMNSPHSLIAQYKQQYYLTVSSDQGVASGQGRYDAGTYAQISVSSPASPSYGINLTFNGWQGSIQSSSQSTTVLMNGPMSVTATWRTDYTVLYVTIAAIIAVVAVGALATFYVFKDRRKATPMPQQTQ